MPFPAPFPAVLLGAWVRARAPPCHPIFNPDMLPLRHPPLRHQGTAASKEKKKQKAAAAAAGTGADAGAGAGAASPSSGGAASGVVAGGAGGSASPAGAGAGGGTAPGNVLNVIINVVQVRGGGV